MAEVFTAHSRARSYRLDDQGVWEYTAAGELPAFVAWADIQFADGTRIRPANGAGVRLRLRRPDEDQFRAQFFARWRNQYPRAWRHNQERWARQLRRYFQLWFPLMLTVPLGCLYVYYWVLGSSPSAAEWLAETNRGARMIGLCVVLCWLSDLFFWRRYFRLPPN